MKKLVGFCMVIVAIVALAVISTPTVMASAIPETALVTYIIPEAYAMAIPVPDSLIVAEEIDTSPAAATIEFTAKQGQVTMAILDTIEAEEAIDTGQMTAATFIGKDAVIVAGMYGITSGQFRQIWSQRRADWCELMRDQAWIMRASPKLKL